MGPTSQVFTARLQSYGLNPGTIPGWSLKEEGEDVVDQRSCPGASVDIGLAEHVCPFSTASRCSWVHLKLKVQSVTPVFFCNFSPLSVHATATVWHPHSLPCA